MLRINAKGGDEMSWKIGIDIYALLVLCVK